MVPRIVTSFGCALLAAGIVVPERFAEGVITTAAPEFAITFTPDGRTAYFNRASTDRRTLSIMVSRLAGADWQQPLLAGFSGKHRDVDPFVTPDGNRLYFSSDRPTSPSDNEPDFNTWYMDAKDGDWSEPRTFGEPLNSRAPTSSSRQRAPERSTSVRIETGRRAPIAQRRPKMAGA